MELKLRFLLFISPAEPNSRAALRTVRRLLATEFKNTSITVVDRSRFPRLAKTYGVIETPALVKLAPRPRCIIKGDLARQDRVVAALAIALFRHENRLKHANAHATSFFPVMWGRGGSLHSK